MPQSHHGPNGSSALAAPSAPPVFTDALAALEAEFALVLGRPEHVLGACDQLRRARADWSDPTRAGDLRRLTALVEARTGPLAEALLAFLGEAADTASDPWLVLRALCLASDAHTCQWALDRAVALAAADRLALDERAARDLAAAAEREDAPLNEPVAVERLAVLLSPLDLATLYLDPDTRVGRLAARVLDRSPTPPGPDLAARVLGPAPAARLEPYLTYTRASHLDLLDLASPGGDPPIVAAIERAEAICGEACLREVVAELGWPRVRGGLTAHRLVGVSLGGSFPLTVTPSEAALLEACPGAERAFDRLVFVAHGATAGAGGPDAGSQPVQRFRAYNLAHADALSDILDVAPLTIEKVHRLLARMEAIVAGFTEVFGAHADECAVVRDVHQSLESRIRFELASAEPERPLSPELTRLVQMFEDPATPGDIRTLHGLKRYLHQRGLKLGVTLAESGRDTNRTVDLVVATPRRAHQVARVIEYVDFEEPARGPGEPPAVPPAVAAVADAFARQLLHGRTSLPKVKIFCYGNEVHYFIAFRNHPAFLRIDFSPPLRGGMIDLEYYGVSKYEMSAHPDLSLDAIAAFFRRLDFDVHVDNTRVSARYDKERAVDLTDLLDRVAHILRLAPYLMDVDWIIGNLALDADARPLVAAAWADFFARWGVLPVSQLLSADRQGIVTAVEPVPGGEREVVWPGRAPYRDRFSDGVPPDVWPALRGALAARGLDRLVTTEPPAPLGQLAFERHALDPLHAAVRRGEVLDDGDTLAPSPPARFERLHEAERFAAVLGGDADTLARSARLARLAAELERGLQFETTGAVNGYDVQRASLPLGDGRITLFVLRDGGGIFRLALFAAGDLLCRTRATADDPWRDNTECDADALAAHLRRNNLPATWIDPEREDPERTAAAIRAIFDAPRAGGGSAALKGEHAVAGLGASPGRAAGLARLGRAGRHPEALEDGILVAPALAPEDAALIARASAVVSTGGGILSHAGLMAMQFGKPALVVGGVWRETPGGAPIVACQAVEYDEDTSTWERYELRTRRNVRRREVEIREGDLLVADADENVLRALGREPDALALHEALRQMARANRELADASADTDLLSCRGHRLRARHQIEKLLGRLSSPALVAYAAHELLVGEAAGGRDDRAHLVRRLLERAPARDAARAAVQALGADLARRESAAIELAARVIPLSEDPNEIVALRLDAVRLRRTIEDVAAALPSLDLPAAGTPGDTATLDALAAARLGALWRRLLACARRVAAPDGYWPSLRHMVRQLERLAQVLDPPAADRDELGRLRAALDASDAEALARHASRRIVEAEDGGLELQPITGSKAANLGEAVRLGDAALVPGWFVVTDRAFREALACVVPAAGAGVAPAPLHAVIDGIVSRADLTDDEKSALVRRAWDAVRLPADLVEAIVGAYRRLAGLDAEAETAADLQVAIRSSAREEDTDAAARAGEFDTFLFVRGEQAVLDHVKRAWSGLWTARALHTRARLGRAATGVGGGVLVQRMIDSRVSGVLHTVNVAERRLREMVINAGLGLGEGVVSGAVAADMIIVSKADSLASSQLRFRYVTADKRERVVFDRRFGSGTRRESTLYHQRLRPALEYVELCELVHAAARLESAYGQPLDMEFAIEGTALFILQIRPVPAALDVWRDTVDRHPLAGGPS